MTPVILGMFGTKAYYIIYYKLYDQFCYSLRMCVYFADYDIVTQRIGGTSPTYLRST